MLGLRVDRFHVYRTGSFAGNLQWWYPADGLFCRDECIGTTIVMGGYGDSAGKFWIFNRQGTTWFQYGNSIAPTNGVGAALQFGYSIAIDALGGTVVVGGNLDSTNDGAVWIYS